MQYLPLFSRILRSASFTYAQKPLTATSPLADSSINCTKSHISFTQAHKKGVLYSRSTRFNYKKQW